MNENHIDQTQFSEKKKKKKHIICIFAIWYHTDNQASKQYFKSVHNLNNKISSLLGEFDFRFFPGLGEDIASNNTDIPKIYG